jgi:ABC-type transport auxiliary lipoprotein component
VRQFETPAYLRQGRIVYSQPSGEVGFYEYHRWAVDPAAVATAMVEALRASFLAVAPYDGHDRSDFLMTGRLEKLSMSFSTRRSFR